MGNAITVKGNISKILLNKIGNNYFEKIIQAGSFIIEKEYVKQVPVDKGNLRREIKTKKTKDGFKVSTEATIGGKPYPITLHSGTGIFRGAEDFGYTTGRVRAGTTLWGIGGVRPNKYADRTKKKSEKPYLRFINLKIKEQIEKMQKV